MRTRDIVLAVGLVVLAVLLLGTFSIMGRFGYGEAGFGRGFGGPGMMVAYGFWWWPVLMLVFWAAIIVGVVSLIGRVFATTTGTPGASSASRQLPGDSALEILRERYAKGEITKEQFDQMRSDLSQAKQAGSA